MIWALENRSQLLVKHTREYRIVKIISNMDYRYPINTHKYRANTIIERKTITASKAIVLERR